MTGFIKIYIKKKHEASIFLGLYSFTRLHHAILVGESAGRNTVSLFLGVVRHVGLQRSCAICGQRLARCVRSSAPLHERYLGSGEMPKKSVCVIRVKHTA